MKNNNAARLCQFVLLWFCATCFLCSQSRPFARYIKQKDGLNGREVFLVKEDRRGFMWVGTVGGLQLYDGHRFCSLSQMGALDLIGNNRIISMDYENDSTLVVAITDHIYQLNTSTLEISDFIFVREPGGEIISSRVFGGELYWVMIFENEARLYHQSIDGSTRIIDRAPHKNSFKTGYNYKVTDEYIAWSSGSIGLRVLDAKTYRLVSAFYDEKVSTVSLMTNNQEFYFINSNGQLCKLSYPYSANDIKCFDIRLPFYSIIPNGDEVWLTGDRLFKLDSLGSVIDFSWIYDGLEIPGVNAVYTYSNGGTWLSTKDGIVYLVNSNITINQHLRSYEQGKVNEFRGLGLTDDDSFIAIRNEAAPYLDKVNLATHDVSKLVIQDVNKRTIINISKALGFLLTWIRVDQ